MKLPGGARFWIFGAFPVFAAAAFQVAIIIQAAEALGQFFLFQSVVAIGLSVACLQPRTWNAELRLPSRLRWALLLSLGLLAVCGLCFALVPSPLGLVVGAFLTKKVCDVGREFVFLGKLDVPAWVTTLVTVMEIVGIILLFPGFLLLAIMMYATAGSVLIAWALRAVHGQSWAVRWVIREIPHAVSMTLFNMGSRLFLVSAANPVAHLTIGSILQVVNFLSPVTFAVFSRTRIMFLYLGGWLLCASAIFAGAQAFIWVGGGSAAGPWHTAAFAGLLAFNSSAVVKISAHATRGARALLGVLVSCWVGLGTLLGLSGIFSWETAFILFLVGNTGILACIGLGRWSPARFLRRGRLKQAAPGSSI